eukprot:6804574-Pyramimonas_sp.AAC.1
MAPHRLEVPAKLHIFTEGSDKPRSPSTASWAMAVVGEPFSFLGWWAAYLDRSCRTATGTDMFTSTESEFIGILRAAFFLASHDSTAPAE